MNQTQNSSNVWNVNSNLKIKLKTKLKQNNFIFQDNDEQRESYNIKDYFLTPNTKKSISSPSTEPGKYSEVFFDK